MSTSTKKINLVLKEGFENSTLGKILSWSLSAGRLIVILTELVVILAFLSRFWLDRTLTDLNESNTNKRKQIEASSSFEANFRNIQDRLANYQKYAFKTNNDAKIAQIASLLPADVTLTKINLSKKDFQISGISLSESGLSGFMKGISNSPPFKNVVLSSLNLATDGQQGLVFTIKGSIAQEAKN
ncbi:MAG: PilN domain-containing protein [Candidatus Blackburnbacteria bacterium]|nr:PilN domain-containing protein [Candidatus Blackburnbacteria bacterium]